MKAIYRVILFIFLAALAAPARAQDGTPVPSPFVYPTLSASPTPACDNGLRNRLVLYERARVTDDEPAPLNLRQGPSTSFDVIVRIPSGDVFFVLEGPECSDVYSWYRVRYHNQEGWIAEGTASRYFAEPYLPG